MPPVAVVDRVVVVRRSYYVTYAHVIIPIPALSRSFSCPCHSSPSCNSDTAGRQNTIVLLRLLFNRLLHQPSRYFITIIMTINTPARPRFGESDINNDVSTVIDIEPEPSSSGDNGISPGALAASSWYFNLSNKAVLVFFPIACFVAILHFSSSSNYVNVKNSVREGGFRVVKAGTTRSTKKSYVTRALKIDDDDKSASVTVDRNRACDVPEHEQLKLDKADSWGYFDELIEKNRETVLLARGVEEYTPKRDFGNLEQHAHDSPEDKEDGVDDNLEPSSIPHRLIFTHKDNLLDCDVSSSVNSEPSLHTYAHNVRDTIKSYKEVWGDDMQVTFLTDEDCRRALYDTEPELLAYYDDLAGMFKGDLCRSAELFLNGG
jgi:hypothetical protein